MGNYCCSCANTNAEFASYDPDQEHNPAYLADYDEKTTGGYFQCDPTKAVKIQMGTRGLAAQKPTRMMDVFEKAVKNCPDTVAMRKEYKADEKSDDYTWKEWTYTQYWDECMNVAKALVGAGLEVYQPVNIIGFNSPQWHWADMGAILAGGIAAGVYTTNNPDACRYVAEHSKCRVIFMENNKQLTKYMDPSVYKTLPNCKYYVMWDGQIPANANQQYEQDNELPQVLTWNEFIALGKNVKEQQVRDRWEKITPGHCSTLIYTSGTTGKPKAVMASHDNMTWTCCSMMESIPLFDDAPNRIISYLPLSHIAAQMADIVAPLTMTARNAISACTVTFARPDALKGSLGLTLAATQPTLFFGVPRVWEKFADKIRKVGRDGNCCLQCISGNLKPKNQAFYEGQQVGGSESVPCCFCCADCLVASKVKGKLGLDQCKLMLTGAAPISMDVLLYMAQLGIPVKEAFGMSETTALATGNRPGWSKYGTCGPSFKGVEVKIGDEKEILIRGRNIMMGYMYNEDKTRETIDGEGYLHSGDQGRFDNECLKIIGRIKDLIIGAGGENIAPIPIEQYLELNLPAVSKVVMIGDKRKYNVALVSLKCKGTHQEGFSTDLVDEALEVCGTVTTCEQAAKDPTWEKYIETAIKEYNGNEKICEKRASRIQYFKIIPDGDFSMPNGCIGPTLKLKRTKVSERYSELIESMY